ncbi:hypothetical protein D3C73_1201460 [compost metagenome]
MNIDKGTNFIVQMHNKTAGTGYPIHLLDKISCSSHSIYREGDDNSWNIKRLLSLVVASAVYAHL